MGQDDVRVEHRAVDELPGGVPMLWFVKPPRQLPNGSVVPGSLLRVFSRQATVDEIATAFDPMYRAMCSTVALAAVENDAA